MAFTEEKISLGGILVDKGKDIHEFVWKTGGELLLDFQHPDGVGTTGHAIELVLYDASNNIVTKMTVRGHHQLQTTVAEGGTYYLSVRDVDSATTAPGTYTFVTTLKNTPGVIYDGPTNNGTTTALDVSLHDVIRGRLDASENDVFRLTADTGGKLELRFAHPKGIDGSSIQIQLTDDRGNAVLASSLRADGTLLTTLPTAGDYFVSVKGGVVPDPGLYTITPVFSTYKDVIYDSPNDGTAAGAQSLPLGRTAIGTLSTLEKDYYKFDTSAGGQLSVNFLHPQGPGTQGARLSIEVLDSQGGSVATKTVFSNDLFTVALPSEGTYYLKIADIQSGAQTGFYSLMAGLVSNGGKNILLTNADAIGGTGGNDVVHGSTGRDTMTIDGNAAAHQIAVYPGGVTVLDKTGKNGFDTLFNVERLKFSDTMVAIDVDGVGGQAFRLYEAAFNRAADKTGLGFWIHQLDNGASLKHVAQGFITSAEFVGVYGAAPANDVFVTKLYQNVLDRAPDAAGVEFWVNGLARGIVDRADVLIAIANSDENVAKLVGVTMLGMEYTPWGG